MTDFTGTGGNDVLVGTDGNDNLYALGGADFLKGLFGDDYIDGGAGNDRATYYLTNPTFGGVTVSLLLQGQPQNVGSQGVDTLVNIEDLSGTPFADILTGDNGDNWLWGSPATLGPGNISALNNDQLYGMGGNDLLVVGIGNHTIDGGADNDTLRFTENGSPEGPVTIDLNLQGEAQVTGQGTWTVSNIENLSGGVANDILTGDDNWNVLAGDNGDDTLYGGGGADTLLGDGRIATNANNAIRTTLDVVDLGDVGNGNDILHGGDGNDVLIGGGGNDSLYGDADADLLRAGLGDDLIDGGDGIDRAGFYQTDPNIGGVTVSLMLQDQAQDTGSQGMDTLHSIENLSGTPFADVLTGDDGSNWIWGSPAVLADGSISNTNNDQLYGMGGDDILEVGIGDHIIDGGADTDAIRFTENAGADGPVTINLNQQDGTAQNTGQGNWVLLNIENACGGTGNDTITGDGNVNVLAGDNGNDTLNGGGGADTLYGDGRIAIDDTGAVSAIPDLGIFGAGNGNDALNGQGGDDSIYGGGGIDTAFGGDGSDTIYGGDGNDQLFGGNIITSLPQALDGNDTIYGEAGNDLIRGGSGDDYLDGGIGDDNLRGDTGNDTLVGGDGRDFVSYRFDDSGVTSGVTFDASNFASSANFTMSDGRGGTDTLSDVESLGITGSAFNDILTGSQFATSTPTSIANVISGNDGNDQLYGGNNADQLNGGNGDDYVEGRGGDDFLTGDAGNDNLRGDLGSDTIDGGAGWDTTWYRFDDTGGTSGITFDASSFNVTQTFTMSDGRGGTDTLSNVENLQITGSGYDDFLTGSQYAVSDATHAANIISGLAGNDFIAGGGYWDQLDGGDGNDALEGGAGNDSLTGGAGSDSLDGGSGNDTMAGGVGDDYYYVDSAGDIVTENAGEGVDTVRTTLTSYTIGANVENLVASVATSITGNELANFIDASAATLQPTNSVINAGAGDDTIAPGRGIDSVDGGTGMDTLVVDYSALTTGVKMGLPGATGNGSISGSKTDTISFKSIEAFSITTGSGSDSIATGDGNDTIKTGAGGDGVICGIGDDHVELGDGFDSVRFDYGFTSADYVDGGASTDGMTVYNGASLVLSNVIGIESLYVIGGIYNLTTVDQTVAAGSSLSVNGGGLKAGETLWFDGSAETNGQFTITGGVANDAIKGGALADTINTGAGNDGIWGGAGDDVMTGGNGVDTFTFGAGSGHDRITDFTSSDKIAFDTTSGVTSFGQLIVAQVGKDAVISWGGSDNITLTGVKASTVNASEFQFGTSAAAVVQHASVEQTSLTLDTSTTGSDQSHFDALFATLGNIANDHHHHGLFG